MIHFTVSSEVCSHIVKEAKLTCAHLIMWKMGTWAFFSKQDWINQYLSCGVFFKSVKQHSHLFNLNLCCSLVVSTRPDASDKPLFNIISISHSVQLFDHLLTFECLLLIATSCDHEQQACMLATNACLKHQLNVTRSRKSCTKIAEFALVLAFLQTASKKPR